MGLSQKQIRLQNQKAATSLRNSILSVPCFHNTDVRWLQSVIQDIEEQKDFYYYYYYLFTDS